MAEDKPASEKTEEPTPERLRKAREQGQVAQSQEVSSVMMLAGLLVSLALMGGTLQDFFARQLSQGLSFRYTGSMDINSFQALLVDKMSGMIMILVPFMLAAAGVSIFSSMLVGGVAFCPKALTLKLDRISPIKGLRNLLSMRSLSKLIVSLLKLAMIAGIIYHFVGQKRGDFIALHWSSPSSALTGMCRLVGTLVLRMIVGLAAIAGVDWIYQRWQYKRQLRMTRQEVKEERRLYEQSPETRNRIRGIQMTMARKRMLQQVPEADVIVANPTHVAVALRYAPADMEAPEVIAKGADLMAVKIKEVAREHNIPIIEKPTLARALYSTVEPGQPVPESLFVAVAEVLAMIYRVRDERMARTAEETQQ